MVTCQQTAMLSARTRRTSCLFERLGSSDFGRRLVPRVWVRWADFKANDDPIDGVAILQGQNPDLLMLRVRLPPEQRDLAPLIIQDLLLRQRRDAR